MDILSLVQVNWSVIITINLLTHFAKMRIPLIKPYCPYVVLCLSALYAILVSLIAGISLYQALEAGFLHAAVASYVYNLIHKPANSRTVGKMKQKVRNITNNTFNSRR